MRIKVLIAAHGGKEWVEVEAGDASSAVRNALRAGLRVLAVESPKVIAGSERKRRFPLLIFCQELLALLDAGLNLVEAMATLHKKEIDPSTRTVLNSMLARLHEGRAFSETLAEHPSIFPQVLVAGVAASERTGTLNAVVGRFIHYQLQLDVLRRKISASLVYPVLLLIVGGLVTLFLLGYVVPKFSVVLESSGREIAAGSRWMMQFGRTLHEHPLLVFGGFSLVAAGAAMMALTQTGRGWISQTMSRFPPVTRLVSAFSLTRFYRTVGTLVDSGIPLSRALGMARPTLPIYMQPVLVRAEERLRAGEMLSAALSGSPLLPPVAESLMQVGERSGKLAEMMERTARFLEDDLGRRIDLFSRTFEPILMALIGLVIGAVVVLMYMPIFDLVGSFG